VQLIESNLGDNGKMLAELSSFISGVKSALEQI
jgi:hypothetical protein